mgnify:CR=1 FL=1
MEPHRNDENSIGVGQDKSDEKEQRSNDVISAIYDLLEDSVEDAQSLRDERKPLADKLVWVVGGFYVVFLLVVGMILFCPAMVSRVAQAQNLYIVILILLAAIPTLVLVQLAKAVFSKKSSMTDTALTPLEAVIKLMNEIRGSN